MDQTLSEQLALHDAAELCSIALLRPASVTPEQLEDIIGVEMGTAALVRQLEPVLEHAWPDRPAEVVDLAGFLSEARTHIIARAKTLARGPGFVPAAEWSDSERQILFEHLQLEVAAIVGGVRSEPIWFAFETPDTAPLHELIVAGMRIKLRALGAFLVLNPTHYADELRAADFFTAGGWQEIRSADIAAHVLHDQTRVHKQVAHLTLSRPLPNELGVYRPSSYRNVVEDHLHLLGEFTEHVDERLVPDWWADWLPRIRGRLDWHDNEWLAEDPPPWLRP